MPHLLGWSGSHIGVHQRSRCAQFHSFKFQIERQTNRTVTFVVQRETAGIHTSLFNAYRTTVNPIFSPLAPESDTKTCLSTLVFSNCESKAQKLIENPPTDHFGVIENGVSRVS